MGTCAHGVCKCFCELAQCVRVWVRAWRVCVRASVDHSLGPNGVMHVLFVSAAGGVAMALHAGARSLLDAVVGVSDMCLLEPLDEDHFLDNLQRRFQHNQIYVSVPRSGGVQRHANLPVVRCGAVGTRPGSQWWNGAQRSGAFQFLCRCRIQGQGDRDPRNQITRPFVQPETPSPPPWKCHSEPLRLNLKNQTAVPPCSGCLGIPV